MRHEATTGIEDPSCNYRVTWESDWVTHERIFVSRDEAWDFYQGLKKSRDAFKSTWEIISA